MDHRIVKVIPFKVIGFGRVFDNADAYKRIPEFWNEIFGKDADKASGGSVPNDPRQKAIADNCIGEYGVCIDDAGCGKFRYLIAGKYMGGEVPEGMTVYEIPGGDWAVFDCIGPMPDALQSVNTRVFGEWLPGNPDYEFRGNTTVEWYDCGCEADDPNYRSAIWVPVKKKE